MVSASFPEFADMDEVSLLDDEGRQIVPENDIPTTAYLYASKFMVAVGPIRIEQTSQELQEVGPEQ